jgi:hypothetical protein
VPYGLSPHRLTAGGWRPATVFVALLAFPALLLTGAVTARAGTAVVNTAPAAGASLGLPMTPPPAIGPSGDGGARYPLRIDPFVQQGPKLTGSGEVGPGWFGWSVALSADGDTALIGGPQDDPGADGSAGAAWVFTRSGPTWAQQGLKLTPTGLAYQGPLGSVQDDFGYSVALSADGNTALIGGPYDNTFVGAAWVFTRSGSTWAQQGPALTPGSVPADVSSDFGFSVALSGDGDTALISDPQLEEAFMFTRSGSTWAREGPALTGDDEIGAAQFGYSVALSSDGETALIGGPFDNLVVPYGNSYNIGAAWVFSHVLPEGPKRAGRPWAQQGPKLTGGGDVGKFASEFGSSVALAADGNTALIGGDNDNSGLGAAWVLTRSRARSGSTTWAQQGPKLTGSGSSGLFGNGVALSADGNLALVADPGNEGAWVYTRSGSAFAQHGTMLTGSDEIGASFGISVALSADGSTALVGGNSDNASNGAAWAFGETCQAQKQACAPSPTPVAVPGPTTTTAITLPLPRTPITPRTSITLPLEGRS